MVAVVELPELVGRTDAEVARWARESDRVLVTEDVVDHASPDVEAHAGLLRLDARRWPRTRSGRPRLAAALGAWLEARSDRDGSGGAVEWS